MSDINENTDVDISDVDNEVIDSLQNYLLELNAKEIKTGEMQNITEVIYDKIMEIARNENT